MYFDTSALIKLIVVEDGSDVAAELWDSYPAACSVLAYPEARAALASARRARRLTARAHDRAVGELNALNAELVIVGVDEALAQRAGELADERALRGYDAVHLASALALGPGDTILVTWDRDLSNAAVYTGLAVAPAL
ncbi:MAG TPA: type II toxin-antitoxin system VapC family toxin [Solirubrobacteraceae bacterium]|nr:type II toxin-antitoxin system VapC family toxin [Solirubrobacteraceae bacterium]